MCKKKKYSGFLKDFLKVRTIILSTVTAGFNIMMSFILCTLCTFSWAWEGKNNQFHHFPGACGKIIFWQKKSWITRWVYFLCQCHRTPAVGDAREIKRMLSQVPRTEIVIRAVITQQHTSHFHASGQESFMLFYVTGFFGLSSRMMSFPCTTCVSHSALPLGRCCVTHPVPSNVDQKLI